MQSLLCKALETFLRHHHGHAVWEAVLREADLEGCRFELFHRYRPEAILALHRATEVVLERPNAATMEDLGNWVCVHPQLEPVRRLIRFSGETFEEMIYSLEAMPDRVELAMPGLVIPDLSLTEEDRGRFLVRCRSDLPGIGAFLLGVLRAMADDYGALAFLELSDGKRRQGAYCDMISVQLLDDRFATPRDFNLGGAA